MLWPDTFTNHFAPEIAVAAAAVLDDAGFEVVVPETGLCCGLTWISTGQLRRARKVLRHTLAALAPELRAGTLVVGLEPSCTAVFRHDLHELFPLDQDACRLRDQTRTLAELLHDEAPEWRPPHVGGDAIVQAHCHQRAVMGMDADQALLGRAGVDAELLDSGCCGLAGNFGFERGHHDVSIACAERVLLPAVRSAAPETAVLADGFSCRTQIAQNSDRQALHIAQVLAAGLRPTAPAGAP
jgi:Fe-S oxidoreductase